MCDAAYDYAKSKHLYKTCLTAVGFVTQDNSFCETQYALASEAKERFKCYGILGLDADAIADRKMAEQIFSD